MASADDAQSRPGGKQLPARDGAQTRPGDQELAALEEMARQAGTHWRVCDDVLSCGTTGAFHLLADGPDGAPCAVAVSTDVLDEDRARLTYLAAAANLAPALAAEVRRLRAQLEAGEGR